MRFTPQRLGGLFLIEPGPHADERGFFARVYCEEEFRSHDLVASFPQHSISFNHSRGTLRGMHFQRPPHGEVKLVRCTHGAIHDVVVDVRKDSPTYGEWAAFDLTARNRLILYVPEGFAHGFQTLADNTEVLYAISAPFVAASASGVRFDDPAIGISWPEAVTCVSARDREWPLLGNKA